MELFELMGVSMGQLEGVWMEILQFRLGHTSVHLLSFDVETSCDWVKCRLLRFGVRRQSFFFVSSSYVALGAH